jgi:predicted acyl esterase
MGLLLCGLLLTVSGNLPAQGPRPGGLSEEALARRWALEKELQAIAVIERKVMVPMRDGKRMAADIYRPGNIQPSSSAPPTISTSGMCATAPRVS